MSGDAVVHLEVLLGDEVMIWESGMATVCVWDDGTDGRSPSARDLAATVGVSA
jgi:hypothetical protein